MEIDEEFKKIRAGEEPENGSGIAENGHVREGNAMNMKDVALQSRDKVLARSELLQLMTDMATQILADVGTRSRDKGLIKFGMVGFPNVGKSSVINALLGASTCSHKTQRVAVGATPGKTKHFQVQKLSFSRSIVLRSHSIARVLI